MRACVLLLTLLSLPAVSQTIIGTVEKIDKDQLQVKCRDGVVTLRIDEKTTVCKVKMSHYVSRSLALDDRRSLTAANISAEVTLFGVITESSPAHLTVVPNSATSSDGKAAVLCF